MVLWSRKTKQLVEKGALARSFAGDTVLCLIVAQVPNQFI